MKHLIYTSTLLSFFTIAIFSQKFYLLDTVKVLDTRKKPTSTAKPISGISKENKVSEKQQFLSKFDI